MTTIDLTTAHQTWQHLVERKEASANPHDRNSYLVGIDIEKNAPVLVPWSVLHDGHCHISGRTGTGKTAAALMSMALQLLRRGDRSENDDDKGPLVIIDLKGDRAFFNTMRQAAAEHGRTFRYFSTHVGDDYHFFDPLQIFQLGCVTPIQLASEFVRAFSLDYGLVYGGLYFTHQNLGILIDAVKEMIQRDPTKPTIALLSRILDRISRKEQHKDARHIQLCLKFLAECEQVNIELQREAPSKTIDMLRVLEDCEVVYFYLELEGEAPSLRQIAALALYTLVHATKERRWRRLPQRQTYVMIDEFYHIAGKSFGELLSTVRHLGLHLILANQTRSQLENHDRALPSIVEANTVVKQAFSLTLEEAETMAQESGEVKEYLTNYSHRLAAPATFGGREAWTTRLKNNDILMVNDTRLASLLLVQDGEHRPGARVRMVQSLYPIPKVLYDLYQDTPLPRRQTEVPVNAPATSPVPASATTVTPTGTKTPQPTPNLFSADLHARMESLWKELEDEERKEQSGKDKRP